ncbi:hypothetical protein BaRGS_00000097 [Batillaria attramentaria]|uniref:Uncharacterized protein n=1 Tax=Batillaria attramentaria TaxID=370345 RepID=A0ABD0MBY1_9CAEN
MDADPLKAKPNHSRRFTGPWSGRQIWIRYRNYSEETAAAAEIIFQGIQSRTVGNKQDLQPSVLLGRATV